MAGCPAAGQNCYEGLMPFCICRQQKNKTWCSLAPNEGFVGCAVLSPPRMSASEIQGDSKPQGWLLGFIFRYLQHSPWIIPHWPSLPWLPFHNPMALIKAFESKKGMLSCYPKGSWIIPAMGFCFWMLDHLSQKHIAMSDGKKQPQRNLHPRICTFLTP